MSETSEFFLPHTLHFFAELELRKTKADTAKAYLEETLLMAERSWWEMMTQLLSALRAPILPKKTGSSSIVVVIVARIKTTTIVAHAYNSVPIKQV